MASHPNNDFYKASFDQAECFCSLQSWRRRASTLPFYTVFSTFLFTTFSEVFQGQYAFSSMKLAVSFLHRKRSWYGTWSFIRRDPQRAIKKKIAKNEKPEPEDRLPQYIVLPASLSIPVGPLHLRLGSWQKRPLDRTWDRKRRNRVRNDNHSHGVSILFWWTHSRNTLLSAMLPRLYCEVWMVVFSALYGLNLYLKLGYG